MENDLEVKTQARKRLPTWVFILAFAILLAFMVLMGIGLKRAQAGPITVGSRVPSFDFTTFDGQKVNTADFQGKVMVINFWASWCKPCEQEAAELEAAWRNYQPSGQVEFIGLDYVDTEKEALGYLEKFSITYPNGPDLETKVSQMFRIQGVPETYIVDQQGMLAYVKKGPFISIDEITGVIDGLLD